MDRKPHVIYSALDAKGKVMFDCPVDIPVPVMMHDLQITADYAIILDTCVEFSPKVQPHLMEHSKGARCKHCTCLHTAVHGLTWPVSLPAVLGVSASLAARVLNQWTKHGLYTSPAPYKCTLALDALVHTQAHDKDSTGA